MAAVASCLICSTVYLVVSEARRIQKRFFLEEEEIVSFSELHNLFPKCASSSAPRCSTGGDFGSPAACGRGGVAAAPSPADLRFNLQGAKLA